MSARVFLAAAALFQSATLTAFSGCSNSLTADDLRKLNGQNAPSTPTTEPMPGGEAGAGSSEEGAGGAQAQAGAGGGAAGGGPQADPGGAGGEPGAGMAGGSNGGNAGAPMGNGGSPGGAAGAGGDTGAGGASGGSGGASGGSGGASGGGGGASGGSGGASGGAAGASTGGAPGEGGSGGQEPALPKRALIYHYSTFNPPTLASQAALFEEKLKSWEYEVDVQGTLEPDTFSSLNLQRYGAVLMLNTCFVPFGVDSNGSAESTALQAFVEAGGALVGTHCTSIAYRNADPPHEFNQLLGGRGGPDNFTGMSSCRKLGDHPSVAALPATFNYSGNLDATDFVRADSTVSVECTWAGNGMITTSISWHRTEGKGRVFYTNFAKAADDLMPSLVADSHIYPGLAWALRR